LTLTLSLTATATATPNGATVLWMTRTQDGLTLQLSIEHSLEQTYAFLREPENFPKWASGLGSGLTRENDKWYASAPQGRAEVTFSEANPHGVADW
jgi:uncharacterized membrane protein